MIKLRIVSFAALLLSLLMAASLRAAEEIITDAQGMDCHVYLPDDIDSSKTYQLMVGVHGAGRSSGKGAGGLASWAQRGDVIVIGPAFQTKGDRPYQNGEGIHAQKLIKLFKDLGKKYKLNDKMFIHGFSGGSQFSHRFAMNHPQYVCGVSAHSGGSWATDGYGNISSSAKKIPFAISCGEKDTSKSWGGAKFGRLEWYKRFENEMGSRKFTYIGKIWPDVGHRPAAGMQDLLRQCFQISTALPGKSATETVEISTDWKNLSGLPTTKPRAGGGNSAGEPYADPSKLAKAAEAAFAIANRETVPDEKLIFFMEKYPPILWQERSGSRRLLEQCEAAAIRWRKKAEDAGNFDGNARKRFEKFTNGLHIKGG